MTDRKVLRSLNVWLVEEDVAKLDEIAMEEYRSRREQAGLLLRDAIRKRHAELPKDSDTSA